MSKKMKGVALGTSPPVYEDARARLKHQNLFQDFLELQKEAGDMRNKLDAAKQRKLTLLAEVRFLRRRYKHLMKTRSLNRPLEQQPKMEMRRKLNIKDQTLPKRDATQFKLPPLPDLKQKARKYPGKEGAGRNLTRTLDLNHKLMLQSGKEAAQHGLPPVSELNYRKRLCSGKEAAVRNAEPAVNLNQNGNLNGGDRNGLGDRTPIFDLNQDTSLSGKEASLPSRAPIFDLNEISMEEEELQNNYEPPKFEEPKKSLIRAVNEEQSNDLKLSVCRNAGEGSSRMGKRKISWQDPVALRV